MTGKLTRWSIFLQEYDFDVVYRKGSEHANVDAISRPVIDFDLYDNNTSFKL